MTIEHFELVYVMNWTLIDEIWTWKKKKWTLAIWTLNNIHIIDIVL